MNSDICTRQNRPHCRFALKLNHGLDKQVSSIRACSVQSRHGKLYSRTRTNTNPNDTEANATGRRGVRACSANGTCDKQERGLPSPSHRARHLQVVRTLEMHRGRKAPDLENKKLHYSRGQERPFDAQGALRFALRQRPRQGKSTSLSLISQVKSS